MPAEQFRLLSAAANNADDNLKMENAKNSNNSGNEIRSSRVLVSG